MASSQGQAASAQQGTHEVSSGLTGLETEHLHIIGLCFSSISFFASVTCLYWLVRMRRNFRHDLIVLLVVSDFVKSLLFLAYNIISIHDPQQFGSSGAFCQANGFLLSMGIEAADAAVFLIALHSTVYIFWPNRAGGESGLYPYRRIAYSFYVLWPIMMASLAFVRGTPAYVDTGQSCYLPTTPWWYRITLSWLPRYAILLAILVMYGSSYTYVRVMMRRYSRRSSEIPLGRPERLVPPTPPLLRHGLLPLPSPTGSSSCRSSSRIPSATPMRPAFLRLSTERPLRLGGSFRQQCDTLHSGTRMRRNWSWTGFEAEHSGTPGPVSPLSVSPMGMVTPSTGAAEPTLESSEASPSPQPPRMSLSRRKSEPDSSPPSSIQAHATLRGLASHGSYRRHTERSLSTALTGAADNFRGGRPTLGALSGATLGRSSLLLHQTGSQVHICTVLRQGPRRSTAADDPGRPCSPSSSTSSSSPPVVALDQATFESGGISRSRDRIRRQLRLLFVYPVVYACVWVFPFASDVSRFRSGGHGGGGGGDGDNSNSNGTSSHSFWLVVFSLVSVCAQGLLDAVVFCTRERPWRHARGGFWESLGRDLARGRRRLALRRGGGGRTREEMFRDSARARSRRVEEREAEAEHGYRLSSSGRVPSAAAAGALNWFDIDVYDGSGDGAARARARGDARGERREGREGREGRDGGSPA